MTGDQDFMGRVPVGSAYDFYKALAGHPRVITEKNDLEAAQTEIARLTAQLTHERQRYQSLESRARETGQAAADGARFKAALEDLLEKFEPGSDGWARSVYIPVDDLNGLLQLVRDGRLPSR